MKPLKGLEKPLDFLGELLAVLTILLVAFLFINGTFSIITDAEVINTLYTIREYAILGTIVVVCMEAAVKRNLIIFAVLAVVCVVAILFSFFPGAVPDFLLPA